MTWSFFKWWDKRYWTEFKTEKGCDYCVVAIMQWNMIFKNNLLMLFLALHKVLWKKFCCMLSIYCAVWDLGCFCNFLWEIALYMGRKKRQKKHNAHHMDTQRERENMIEDGVDSSELRMVDGGLRKVWTPHSELKHFMNGRWLEKEQYFWMPILTI